MSEMIAYCGLDCLECGAYLATRDDDDDLRREVAAQWSQWYDAALDPADINCEGCTAESGLQFRHCATCEMRRCAMEKGLPNCAHCNEYPCETLSGFFDVAPEARERLDFIRSGL